MHKIFGWSAKRSGATITIKGRGEDNKPIKITDVVLIEANGAPIVATTGTGSSYALQAPR